MRLILILIRSRYLRALHAANEAEAYELARHRAAIVRARIRGECLMAREEA